MDDEEQKNNICTPSTCIESAPPEPLLLEGITGFILPLAIICAMLIFLSRIERIRELVYQALKKLEK